MSSRPSIGVFVLNLAGGLLFNLALTVIPAYAQVGSTKTVAQLTTEINTTLASAQAGGITAFQLRQVELDIINSISSIAAGGDTDTGGGNQPFHSILDFAGGLAIGNGTVDAGPAFAAAFAAFTTAGGGYLFVPPGTYNLVTGVITPGNNVIIQGAGVDATTILCTGSFPNNVPIQIPFTLTGTPWPSGPTTYLINAPSLGGSTITTTTAGDAGNFHANDIIFITGDTHGSSFWYPGWYTTVVSAVAGTGVITLAETLPINVGLTRCQKIVNLPQNIVIRDMTIINNSGTGAAIECQGGKNFLFENLKIIPGSGANGVSTGDVTFGIHKNSTFRHIVMEGGAQPLELFVSNNCTIQDCHITEGYILVDGGSFDCTVTHCTIKDPMENNGTSALQSFHGIHIPEYALRNKIISNSIVGIPNGFNGINVSASVDSNRNHIILGNNLVGATGSGGSATGVATSDGPVGFNFFSNLGSAIQMQTTPPEVPIIVGNYFDLASPNGNNINPFGGAATGFFRTVQEGNLRAMTSNTGTPPIAGHTSYSINQGGNTTNITNFTGARAGDVIRIQTTDAFTNFNNGSGITMKNGANYLVPNNVVMQFMALSSSTIGNTATATWIEMSRTQ